jgi:Glycosyltransferases involved in cell wall biogenesis
MASPLISCIIATRNDGKYLSDSIPSVTNQTYKNLECIIIDDGSNDNTSSIVERYLGDPRVSYWKQEQGGVAKARNVGILRSKGEYIAFLDADDCWDHEKLRIQIKYLQSHPELDFCWSDQELMDDSGVSLSSRLTFVPASPLTKQILLSGWNAPPSCWLINRETIERAGRFDENVPSGHEDVEFMFRIADVSSGERCPEAITWRRVRVNSISRDTVAKRVCAVNVYKQMLEYRDGKYRSFHRGAMFAVHRFLAGHCWENGAYTASAVEAIYAACWKPAYIFERAFIDSILLGHLVRLFERIKVRAA